MTDDLRGAIEARMGSGEPFTLAQIYMPYRFRGDDTAYRLADRLIQKWRKAGRITMRREGGNCVWSLTPAGRAALAEAGDRK